MSESLYTLHFSYVISWQHCTADRLPILILPSTLFKPLVLRDLQKYGLELGLGVDSVDGR